MIISRQLKEDMNLSRGKEILKIKCLIKTGRSTTALVINGKGKEEKLTITDMWNQKIAIINPEKETAVVKTKKVEKVVAPKAKKPAERLVVITHEVQRANGIATVYYTNTGRIVSSWKRTS